MIQKKRAIHKKKALNLLQVDKIGLFIIMISGKLFIYLSESRIVISISILCRISFCPRRLSNGDVKDRRMVTRVVVRKVAKDGCKKGGKKGIIEEKMKHTSTVSAV